MLALLLKIKLRQLKYGGEGGGFFSRRERGRHSGTAAENIVMLVKIRRRRLSSRRGGGRHACSANENICVS